MNKRRWILLFIILLIVILLGSFVVKHRNTLEALVDSFRYSQDEVIEKLNENKNDLQQYIDENENITVRDLTQEEAKQLNNGEITEEEAVGILTGKKPETQVPTDAPASKPKEPDAPASKPKEPDASENIADVAISEAIAKLYIQKSKYLGKLDDIEAKVRQEYVNLVKSNNLSVEEKKAAKQQFLNSNLSMVAAWENECDSIVNGILEEIKTALKSSNQDDSIVKKLKEAYLNEKRLKKSYFINRYMD